MKHYNLSPIEYNNFYHSKDRLKRNSLNLENNLNFTKTITYVIHADRRYQMTIEKKKLKNQTPLSVKLQADLLNSKKRSNLTQNESRHSKIFRMRLKQRRSKLRTRELPSLSLRTYFKDLTMRLQRSLSKLVIKKKHMQG